MFPNGTQTVLRRRNAASFDHSMTKRQQEFAEGRSCAAALLSHWNVSQEVGVADDRSPIWPDGFAGSISHSENWVWSTVAQSNEIRSLGVDTEIVVSSKTQDILHDDIVTAQERSVIEALGVSPQVSFTLAFSAKEAFYKCWYPITKSFLEFKQVTIESCTSNKMRIAPLTSLPNSSLNPAWLDVHFLVTDSDVFTATWMDPEVS